MADSDEDSSLNPRDMKLQYKNFIVQVHVGNCVESKPAPTDVALACTEPVSTLITLPYWPLIRFAPSLQLLAFSCFALVDRSLHFTVLD
jgi:hypothetical protein